MYFKSLTKRPMGKFMVFFSFLFLLLVVGCNTEKASNALTAFNVKLNYNYSCLERLEFLSEKAFAIVDTESRQSELQKHHDINEFWNCISGALNYLPLRIKGESNKGYTEFEVTTILERFVPNLNNKESLQEMLMTFKSFLFNNNKNFLEYSDLQIMKRLAEGVHKIHNKYPNEFSWILLQDWDKSNNPLNEKDKSEILNRIYKLLLNTFNPQGSLKRSTVYQILEQFTDSDFLEKYEPVLWDTLRFLGYSDGLEFQGSNYDKLLATLKHSHGCLISGLYGLNRQLGQRSFLEHISSAVFDLVKGLEVSLKNKKVKAWTIDEISKLSISLQKAEVLTPNLPREVIPSILGLWLPKVMSQGQSEFNLKTLHWLRLKIKKFLADQRQLEHLFMGLAFHQTDENLISKVNNEYLRESLRSPWTYNADKNGVIPILSRVQEDRQEDTVEFNYKGLFFLNWQSLFAELVMAAYNIEEKESLLANLGGVTMSELRDVYYHVFEFLLAYKILTENDREGWFRIFNECNLFIPSAVPDDFVSYKEGYEFFNFLFSAFFGMKYFENVQGILCPDKPALNYVVTKQCQEQTLIKDADVSTVFYWMPRFENSIASWSNKVEALWFKGFEEIARKTAGQPASYSMSEIFRTYLAIQYSEILFTIYDEDSNNLLTFKEIIGAYNNFEKALLLLPQIKGTPADGNPEFLRAFFVNFVLEGDFKQAMKPLKVLRVKASIAQCLKGNERPCKRWKAERGKIMQIFSFLVNAGVTSEVLNN